MKLKTMSVILYLLIISGITSLSFACGFYIGHDQEHKEKLTQEECLDMGYEATVTLLNQYPLCAQEIGSETSGKVKKAIEASAHCVAQGGTSIMRESDDGSQYGVCLFDNGAECNEIELLAERCFPLEAEYIDHFGVELKKCFNDGGTAEVRYSESGSKVTVCRFADSSECEMNDYFARYCYQGDMTPVPTEPAVYDPSTGVCQNFKADVGGPNNTNGEYPIWEIDIAGPVITTDADINIGFRNSNTTAREGGRLWVSVTTPDGYLINPNDEKEAQSILGAEWVYTNFPYDMSISSNTFPDGFDSLYPLTSGIYTVKFYIDDRGTVACSGFIVE